MGDLISFGRWGASSTKAKCVQRKCLCKYFIEACSDVLSFRFYVFWGGGGGPWDILYDGYTLRRYWLKGRPHWAISMQASLHAQSRLLFCRETLLTWGTKTSQCAPRLAKPNAPRAQTLVSGGLFLLGSLQACQRLLWEGRLLLLRVHNLLANLE